MESPVILQGEAHCIGCWNPIIPCDVCGADCCVICSPDCDEHSPHGGAQY